MSLAIVSPLASFSGRASYCIETLYSILLVAESTVLSILISTSDTVPEYRIMVPKMNAFSTSVNSESTLITMMIGHLLSRYAHLPSAVLTQTVLSIKVEDPSLHFLAT